MAAATPGPWRARRASWEHGLESPNDWNHPEVWGIAAGEETVHQNKGHFHPENVKYSVDEIQVVEISHDRDWGTAEAAISREADAHLIAHAPNDIGYLLTLVRQQMNTRTEIIAETLLAYAELLESPTYTMNYESAELMLKQIIHLLRRDSEDFDPRNWPAHA